MVSSCPLRSLVGNSVLGTTSWNSEERKGREAKIALWSARPTGRTGWRTGRVTLKSFTAWGEDQGTLPILLPSQGWLSPSRKSELSPDLLFTYFLFLALEMEPLTREFWKCSVAEPHHAPAPSWGILVKCSTTEPCSPILSWWTLKGYSRQVLYC